MPDRNRSIITTVTISDEHSSYQFTTTGEFDLNIVDAGRGVELTAPSFSLTAGERSAIKDKQIARTRELLTPKAQAIYAQEIAAGRGEGLATRAVIDFVANYLEG